MRAPTPRLFPALPPPEDPIRAELFGIERLEQLAESLAAEQKIVRGLGPQQSLLARVEENGRVLRRSNRAVAEAVREARWITPAAEWLLDNFFVIDEQLREIRDDLPVGFYRKLPTLAEGSLAGYPRVYSLAWAFVAHTDSRFEPETLRRFIQAYQRVQPLTIGELWALAISLRVVLVENARRLAEAIVRGRAARQEGDAFADAVLGLGPRGTQTPPEAMSRDDRPQLIPSFAVELMQRLRDQDPSVTPALAWLHECLAAQGTTAEAVALVEHQRQAAMTVTVRNVITSMRLLSALDWSDFFESVSLVDEMLRAGSDFAAQDFASRDSYRHAIEDLSRGSGRTELGVVREALSCVALARARDPDGAHDERRADPGFHLVGGGRRDFERIVGFRPPLRLRMRRALIDAATPGYLAGLLIGTAAILAVVAASAVDAGVPPAGLALLVLLALVPASDLAVALLNRFVTAVVMPVLLPRLDWPAGIPARHRTLVAVPTLLTGLLDVEEQVERLEVHFLANDDGDIRFALLSDWPDAATERAPHDEAILAAARDGIARLNLRHGPAPDGGARFLVLHRRRLWNASERVWMGWERKRGKLHELNRLLRGATDTTILPGGGEALAVPADVRYVVTLDADTRLPMGAVRKLVGTMAHPLNRPRLDPATRRVVEGYAILQPRVTAPLPGLTGSFFQRLCSGGAGIDPYAAAVSDVYQDLFGEGSFTGKGIYDVDAFEAALADRAPDNTLLSHDLFEGLFARAGLVTDVELFESAPEHYLTSAARQHRWARGDWQLLPWILRERLSPVGRWKLVDNLRRTLSMPAVFLTLAAAWAWPGASPGLWMTFLLVALAVPPLLPAIAGAWPRARGVSMRSHLRSVFHDLRLALSQTALTLTTVAFQAWLMGDAVVRTLTRLCLTRRRLLQWKTMVHAASHVPSTLAGFYGHMAGGVLLAALAAALVAWQNPSAWPLAAPVLALWGLAPAIALWVSRPGRAARSAPLSPDEARALRLIARRTWSYFTTFVTQDSRSLPPDNFQETPRPVIAERTSPTNIGLYLLSVVSARDFGWIGTLDAVDRLEATLHTVRGLEHHRGHIYNWYGTRDGRPLEPRYVSSVDSGNFAASLLALANACREMAEAAAPAGAARSGIADAAHLLQEAAQEAAAGGSAGPVAPGPLAEALGPVPGDVLADALADVQALVAQEPGAPTAWAARLAALEGAAQRAERCAGAQARGAVPLPPDTVLAAAKALREAVATHARDLDTLQPWARLPVDEAAVALVARVTSAPSLAETPRRCAAALGELAVVREAAVAAGGPGSAALQGLDALAGGLEHAAAAALDLHRRLSALAAEAREMVTAMDFRLLFDAKRMLFSIGKRMSDGSLDPGHYDLLASEARLLSFVAIAKGDVPVTHWFRLGRLLTPVGSASILLSWSGSMFEYLMPGLLMHAPAGSLLEQTCRLAVGRQITYGADLGVPWGVSESGYAVRDLEMTFQYSNFGVPGLGLRRGLGDELVVAPYATGLAAMIAPREALRNYRELARAGADGQHGFYEAVDYTPARLHAGTQREVVRMYMAHHQAMVIVAIGNVLHDGAMRARFHAEPMVRATELLLQERTPRNVGVAPLTAHAEAAQPDVREVVPPHIRRFSSPHGATPRTQLLSNGRYTVMLTAAGSGYSRWRDLAITRWREDATRDDTGSYLYLRDVASGERWSAGFQPSGAVPESYGVSFSEDRAEFMRRDGAIVTRLEVIVSSEDDAEVRRVSLTNHSERTREIEVTSYAELVLAPAAADASHPAFSSLFVETEVLADRATLLATRRRRAPDEAEIWLAHVVAVEGETIGEVEWETDRGRFLGRGRGVRAPDAVAGSGRLSNTVGCVLDPVASLRRRVRIRPGGTARLAFSTLVATSRREALDLADKYDDVATFERVATLAWTQAQVQMHHLGIGPDEAHLFQTLAGSILYSDRALRGSPSVLARLTEPIAELWAHGISGDRPIILVTIEEADDIGIVRQLLRAHAYWRMKRLPVDLVILNDRAPSYAQDLQLLLETLVRTSQSLASPEVSDVQGRVFTLRADLVTAAQRGVLEGVARVELSSRRGVLAAQVARAVRADAAPGFVLRPRLRPAAALRPPSAPGLEAQLTFFNGLGGFAADGREYVIILRGGRWTPAPWINVIANRQFGCLVSEAGSGCTWALNSQQNLLTAWSNDPVSDPPSETLYVRDDDTGELWTPTPLPIRDEGGTYVVRHGHGYTRFAHDAHGVALELLLFVPDEDPVKISRLTLTNASARPRRLSVTAYLEWVLGATRSASGLHVVTEMDPGTGAMFARNASSRDFGTRIAFADLRGAQTAWTGDRTEFLGRNGSADRPAALSRTERLSGRTGAALDPCCALQTTLAIPAGGRASVVFLVGQAETREQARDLVRRYRTDDLDARLKAVTDGWHRLLGTVEVRTPDAALDLLLNQWLLYQTLACRLWARAAFYQAGGAYGFRDQLQDVLALTVARPDLTRAHILKAASRQFVEGDVQHWWHEPGGHGVRTRISDDLLWLPYATSHYLDVTGDLALLEEDAPFLEGPPLTAEQREAYFGPRTSAERASLFEHCARAIDRSLAVGTHGLPLMGTGDWNDGMNLVGAQGRGESVWLAWFLHAILTAWAPVAAARGASQRAEAWSAHARALKTAVESQGWDGSWYRRAYFDDGTPLGAAGSEACAIDSIAQSWAVLSGAGDPARARQAMAAVDRQLVRDADELMLLLAPPFDRTALEPGYIKGYAPGVRENGGQYTHAALWVVMANLMLGAGDRAARLLAMLNPVARASSPNGLQRYRVEPYVVAGDVYSAAPHIGRGGWTWYTGAAGWMYRTGVEWLLGVRLRGTRLILDPCIPAEWPGFSLTFRYRSSRYEIAVENPEGVCRGVSVLELDSVALGDRTSIPLADDDRIHRVRVVLGGDGEPAAERVPLGAHPEVGTV